MAVDIRLEQVCMAYNQNTEIEYGIKWDCIYISFVKVLSSVPAA